MRRIRPRPDARDHPGQPLTDRLSQLIHDALNEVGDPAACADRLVPQGAAEDAVGEALVDDAGEPRPVRALDVAVQLALAMEPGQEPHGVTADGDGSVEEQGERVDAVPAVEKQGLCRTVGGERLLELERPGDHLACGVSARRVVRGVEQLAEPFVMMESVYGAEGDPLGGQAGVRAFGAEELGSAGRRVEADAAHAVIMPARPERPTP
ncbi:hypothetical protein AB0H37_24780 [Actinomadura sp. NPDC023710]|uniref:hypothetical protein n=1 Tax=Actinomadura sp. NPDC023710 TaxID=3158219 RepID=UPI00340FDC1D